MFRVGQKVVCVDDSAQGARRSRIVVDSIYTIASIVEHTDWRGTSGASTFLRELEEEICPVLGVPTPFALHRFRPVVERKTDISVFTEILRRESSPVDPVRTVMASNVGEG